MSEEAEGKDGREECQGEESFEVREMGAPFPGHPALLPAQPRCHWVAGCVEASMLPASSCGLWGA